MKNMYHRALPKIFSFSIAFFFLLGVLSSAQTAKNLPIRVEKGKTYSKQLFAFGRDIVVEGEVADNVGAIFGDVTVRGMVQGNVSVLNGSIFIEPSGEVIGNIVCVGGKIQFPPSQTHKKVVNIFGPKDDQNQLSSLLGSRTKMALFCFKTLLLFLCVILLAYAFPGQVREASFQLGQDPGYSALMGIAALALFAFGLFASFLLMVVAIGIPLFLLISGALVAFTVFGQVVVFFWMGQKIRKLLRQTWSTVFSIFLAIVIVGLVGKVPFLGMVLQFLILVFGIGVVLHTRFGTNKEWFTRRTRVLSAD